MLVAKVLSAMDVLYLIIWSLRLEIVAFIAALFWSPAKSPGTLHRCRREKWRKHMLRQAEDMAQKILQERG